MDHNSPDPLNIDFSALRTLHLVLAHGSFTRAAETLGVNQSAVSYTIEKLRKVFRDPLFVREAGQQIPTPRCEAIADTTRQMMDGFLRLAEPETFDPARSDQRFVIACNYYERLLIIPPVVHALRRAAPGMNLEIVNSSDIGHDRLLQSDADLLIGPFRRTEAGFYRRDLLEDRYVCLMDPAHPLAGTSPSLEQLLDLDHILITYGGVWRSAYLLELDTLGFDMNVAMRVPSPAGVPRLIEGTSFVSAVPESLGREIGGNLCIVPWPTGISVRVALVWTARTHHSPLHKWMRDLIFRTVRLTREPVQISTPTDSGTVDRARLQTPWVSEPEEDSGGEVDG